MKIPMILFSILMMVVASATWAQAPQQYDAVHEYDAVREYILNLTAEELSSLYYETPISSHFHGMTVPPLDVPPVAWPGALARNPYFWKTDSNGQQIPYIDEYSTVINVGIGVVMPVLIELVKELCGGITPSKLGACVSPYRHSHADHVSDPSHSNHQPREAHEHVHFDDHSHRHNHEHD